MMSTTALLLYCYYCLVPNEEIAMMTVHTLKVPAPTQCDYSSLEMPCLQTNVQIHHCSSNNRINLSSLCAQRKRLGERLLVRGCERGQTYNDYVVCYDDHGDEDDGDDDDE